MCENDLSSERHVSSLVALVTEHIYTFCLTYFTNLYNLVLRNWIHGGVADPLKSHLPHCTDTTQTTPSISTTARSQSEIATRQRTPASEARLAILQNKPSYKVGGQSQCGRRPPKSLVHVTVDAQSGFCGVDRYRVRLWHACWHQKTPCARLALHFTDHGMDIRRSC